MSRALPHNHGPGDLPVGRGDGKIVGASDLAETGAPSGAAMVGFDDLAVLPPLGAGTVQTALNILKGILPTLPRYGNVAIVDAVNGNDAIASVNGLPFLTPAAALAAAVSGDVVLVMPGTYNLAAGLVLPVGVAMTGLAHHKTILQMLNVAGATTLLTMSSSSELQSFTMRLTSAAHVALTGVYFPVGTNDRAHITDCGIEIDNAGAGVGNSEVLGVLSHSTAVAASDIFELTGVTINVTSTGTGRKRGLLVEVSAQTFAVSSTIMRVVGGTDVIGAEVNFAGATLRLETGQISGAVADVSQTLGTLIIGSTILDNYTANGKSFTTSAYGAIQCFADDGALVNGVRYMYPGTSTSSPNEVFIRLPQATLIIGLSVRARIAPGGVDTCSFTVRKNGAPTALTLTLTGAQLTAQTSNLSATFAATDDLSVQTNDTGATQDVVVVLSFY